MNFEKHLAEQLKDEEFKKEWEAAKLLKVDYVVND